MWAFDIHVDDTAEHQELLVGDVDHAMHADGSSDGGEDVSCDHCCHAAAHIIALRPARPALEYPGSAAGSTPYQHTFSFNTTSPPERPPQV